MDEWSDSLSTSPGDEGLWRQQKFGGFEVLVMIGVPMDAIMRGVPYSIRRVFRFVPSDQERGVCRQIV